MVLRNRIKLTTEGFHDVYCAEARRQITQRLRRGEYDGYWAACRRLFGIHISTASRAVRKAALVFKESTLGKLAQRVVLRFQQKKTNDRLRKRYGAMPTPVGDVLMREKTIASVLWQVCTEQRHGCRQRGLQMAKRWRQKIVDHFDKCGVTAEALCRDSTNFFWHEREEVITYLLEGLCSTVEPPAHEVQLLARYVLGRLTLPRHKHTIRGNFYNPLRMLWLLCANAECPTTTPTIEHLSAVARLFGWTVPTEGLDTKQPQLFDNIVAEVDALMHSNSSPLSQTTSYWDYIDTVLHRVGVFVEANLANEQFASVLANATATIMSLDCCV